MFLPDERYELSDDLRVLEDWKPSPKARKPKILQTDNLLSFNFPDPKASGRYFAYFEAPLCRKGDRKIRFCWSTVRNDAGQYLSWVSREMGVHSFLCRERVTCSRVKKKMKARCARLWSQHTRKLANEPKYRKIMKETETDDG
jgi:hypothetical protein